jgi:hypothetical protein
MRAVFVGLGIGVLILAACQPAQTGAEAAATFCSDLRAFNRTVMALDATTGAATVGEFKQRIRAVDDSWTALKESAKAVPQARVNDLETAYGDLKQTVNSIPSDTSLTEAGATVQPKVQAVSRARQQVGSGARCTVT